MARGKIFRKTKTKSNKGQNDKRTNLQKDNVKIKQRDETTRGQIRSTSFVLICKFVLLSFRPLFDVRAAARNTSPYCSVLLLLFLLRIDCLQKTHICKLHMNLKLGMYLEHNK